MTPSVIIDSDGGIDDILAILTLVASREVKVSLISATCGNVDLEQAYRNIIAALRLVDKKIKISKGKNTSLDGKVKRAEEVHGKDGLGNTFLANNVITLNPLKASTALKGAVEADEARKVLAIGPLTNIAEALSEYPYISRGLEEIWVMGGTFKASGAEEFNFSFDPQAAEIVFSNQIPLRVISLEVTQEVLFEREFIENFRNKTKLHRFLSNILNFTYDFSCNRGLKAAHLPDLVAACLFLEPDLANFRKIKVKIDTQTGRLNKNLGGREVLIVESLNREGIRRKALSNLLNVNGGELDAII